MRKKVMLSTAFLASLLPLFLNQYGGLKSVQEITGLINLWNPIGIISVILFAAGVWAPFRQEKVGAMIGLMGTAGMVVAEIYTFLTWHVMTITGELSLRHSIRLAFPEFYIGLFISVFMAIAYAVVHKKSNIPSSDHRG